MTVQLFQRRELPPSRVGQAKPGFDLAEGAELAQAGQALARFAGARFDKLVNSMAANEISEFLGMKDTEIENFSTFVKSRPGASFEELETERNKMIQRLEAVSTKAITETGRQSIRNFMLRNKDLIFAKTQTNMEAIRTRQAFDISESLIKQFETNFDEDGLRDHYESQIQAGLYNREVIFGREGQGGRFANQLAVMDDAAKELVADNEPQIGLDAWAATVTPENPLGDKDVGFAAIQALEGLTGDEKGAAESTYNTQVNNRRGENQIKLEIQQEKDYGDISQLIFFDKNYDAAMQAVDASSLDEKAQSTLFADIERRATAAAKKKPLENDRVEEARLYEESLDIWRGTITKKEFNADLLENQHKLDDSAYQRVSSSAANTLKSSQAESLRRAHTEAGNLIVDRFTQSAQDAFIADTVRGLAPDIAELFINNETEKRQLQFWSLSRYDAELRQWIEENPDKLGKDFFQFSESLKHDYWNQSIEELRKLRERTAGEFTAAAFLAANPLVAQREPVQLTTITTQAEYDKLPKGTRYLDPVGNIAIKR